jgi:hypothetical protein
MQKLRSSVKFAESDLRMRLLHQPLDGFGAGRPACHRLRWGEVILLTCCYQKD